ncbi:hypothetical protein B0H67DRAFT_647144 [Lasiosphaeris hirsuta]|uniref:Apolipoprotein/apolipophorin n=1 Tax=Lasiosphaeris hirsuta TaxID=260670 RepID=A0AA40DTZ9_9PEZI|nr:hypothetical protein B0H67DRAFT_647144 [Lasiosphaeris hirsuta]
MFTTRALARGAPRAARTIRTSKPARRLQSTTTSSQATPPPNSSHLASGLAGGLAGASLFYGIYLFTPSGRMTSKINQAAREANNKYQAAAATLQDKAPSTDEAVDRLKQVCYSYVAWVPGGRAYVDAAFKDVAAIREKRSDEVDELVDETYKRFQGIAKAGLSVEAAGKVYEALGEVSNRLTKLAGGAAEQILENHPQLKEKVGGPIEQLKEMGEQYGPEAKKMADETWDQVGDVLSSGFSAESVSKVKKLVEEKTQKLKELGEEVWEKGMEQAKPYLDKNPQVKKLIEENQDILKKGNATDLFKQVKSAVEKGDTSKLEDYVKKAVEKTKSSTAGHGASSLMGSTGFTALGQFLGGGSGKIQENIEVLTEVVNNHSSEGNKLLEETKEELKKVLEDKAKKAQGIVDSAQRQKAN